MLTVQFKALLDRFRSCRVLVAGDMVADEYILGRPWRISREAPVLVLRHADQFVRPGGATNTANNISTLGAQAIPFGIIGDDEMGRRLSRAIEQAGMSAAGLLVDRGRPTSTKTVQERNRSSSASNWPVNTYSCLECGNCVSYRAVSQRAIHKRRGPWLRCTPQCRPPIRWWLKSKMMSRRAQESPLSRLSNRRAVGV